jgi:hypothetical protein
MTPRPVAPTALAAETTTAGIAAAWARAMAIATAWLRARAESRRQRREAAADRATQAALAGLNVHLLRDIGAPHELIARHVEEIEPRALLAALEVRG